MLNQKISLTFDLQRFADTKFNVATGNTVLSSSAVSLSASQIQAGTLPATRGGTGKTDLSQVTVGTATSANSATTATTAGSLTAARALQVSLSNTAAGSFRGNVDLKTIGVQGILQPAQGGTGQTVLSAVNVGTATTLQNTRTIDGVNFNGSANITHYGTCSTAAATAAKTVACTGFVLATGARITVKFTVTNTAANPTLNVNSTGAKAIYYRGYNVPAAALQADSTYDLIYNGTQYDIIGSIIWVTE